MDPTTTATTSYPIYIGVWTNWSHGKVLGSTLTLTKSDGALLIAFLAFFITIIGTQLWRIICFVLHGVFSTNSSQDALHNQRQVILRNSATPLGSFWLLLQMFYAWSKAEHNKTRPLARLLPLLLATLLVAVSLAAATGLSSRIVQGGDEVLIDGSGCGWVDYSSNSTASLFFGGAHLMRGISKAADYALRCYESTAPASNECSTFLRGALSPTIISNASCPFDSSLCLSQDSNVILDSGLMDSHTDLGLNWPPESRFQLQHKLHCAPLVTEGYRSNYSYGDREFVRYQYGDSTHLDSDCNCSLAISKHVLDDVVKVLDSPFLEPNTDFRIIPVGAKFLNGTLIPGNSETQPLPGLSHHSGDLNLIFLLGNTMLFAGESEDLWYRASTLSNMTVEFGESIRLYRPDEPAWPMGCVPQYQFCKNDVCTGLGSYLDTTSRLAGDGLRLNSTFFGRSSYVSLVANVGNIVGSLGSRALSGTQKGAAVLHVAPRRNEWHRDVAYWFSTIQAALQFNLAEIASGPTAGDVPGLEEFIKVPPSEEKQQFCNSQKIRSTAYTSFSMFWLLFVLVIGILIVLISSSMEWIATMVRRWLPRSNDYAGLEWRANHALHLQRLAHEPLGPGHWYKGSWDIPLVTADTRLAVVDEEEGLPRLTGREKGNDGDRDIETPAGSPGSLSSKIEAVLVTAAAEEEPGPYAHVDENRGSLPSEISSAETSDTELEAQIQPQRVVGG